MRRRLIAASLSALIAMAACGDDTTSPPPDQDSCTPSPQSADDHFVQERDPASVRVALATEIAEGYASRHDPTEALWDWGDGVLMLGLVDLYRLTGNTTLRDHYRAFIDHYVAEGYDHLLVTNDRCPPALSALALYEETCEPAYRSVVEDTLSYLYDDALRTEDGGINHLGTQDTFGVSLWLDSLFMFGNLFVRWGELTGKERHLDAYHDQFGIFTGHLQDGSGWMKHAHDWPLSEQDDGVFWARGNAWVTAVTYEYLRVRQARGESDPDIEAAIAQQVEAIIDAQDAATGL